jgi:hypothetical protein
MDPKPSRLSRLLLTDALVRAAGVDAGNRDMRLAGRARWSREDFNAASLEFARLAPAVAESR